MTVVLMCGIAGSGKTTYARGLELAGYVRLSIDEELWRRFAPYDAAAFPVRRDVVDRELRARLVTLVRSGRDVVVDNSFWRRSDRDAYKRLVESARGRWRLVYLQASPELLRRRLTARASRRDANAAFPITEEILARYLAAFEEPTGEGEEVVVASDPSR